jgi:hypothetical protein
MFDSKVERLVDVETQPILVFMEDQRMVDLAKNKPQATFQSIFEQQFKEIAALRYKKNEEFFVRMFMDV